MRWLVGLGDTLYVWFLTALAIAVGLASPTWLAARFHPAGVLTVTPLFFGLVFCLFSLIRMPDGPVSVFWSRRLIGETMIWCSISIVGVIELLNSEPMLVLPASLVREGLFLDVVSLQFVKMQVIFGLFLGYVIHELYHRLEWPTGDAGARAVGWITLTPRRFLNMVVVLGSLYLLTLSYVAHVGFQDFVNQATSKLIQADIKLFRDYLLSFGIWAPLVSAFLMIFVLVIAPPLPAFVVTFTNGLLFGAFWGTLLSWSSAMVGAAMSFYIARGLGRPVVEKLFPNKTLDWTDDFFRQYGVHSVLVARLIPVVSFALVSYGSGLTAMGFLGFFIATGVGQLPATIVYSWLGEHASGSIMYIFWAFVAVIVMAVIGAAVRTWLKQNRSQPTKTMS